MATVDFHGKAYEVRTAPDPRLRCSLCAVRGCRGAAPCMDLPVGSYLWTEPVRRPDPPRLTAPLPGARRPEPLPAPEEKRGGRGGGRLKPLPEGLAQRVAKAGREGERADVVARREGISLALVYKTWRLEGVYEVRGKRPAQKSLGDIQVGKGRRQHMGGTGKPGRPPVRSRELTERMRVILAKEPGLTNKALGKRLGVGPAWAGRLRKKAGLPVPRIGPPSLADMPGVLDYIKEHNADGNRAIAEALGVSPSAVAHWRAKLDLPRGAKVDNLAKAWAVNTKMTPEAREYVRQHAGTDTDAAMAKALGVDRKTVQACRAEFGLPATRAKTKVTPDIEATLRNNPTADLKTLAMLTGLHMQSVHRLRKALGLPPLRRGTKKKKEEGNAEEDRGTNV